MGPHEKSVRILKTDSEMIIKNYQKNIQETLCKLWRNFQLIKK